MSVSRLSRVQPTGAISATTTASASSEPFIVSDFTSKSGASVKSAIFGSENGHGPVLAFPKSGGASVEPAGTFVHGPFMSFGDK